MKKMTKILLTSGVTLVLGAGAVLSYLQAQRPQGVASESDLVAANIEAMADSEVDAGYVRLYRTLLEMKKVPGRRTEVNFVSRIGSQRHVMMKLPQGSGVSHIIPVL